MAALNYKRLGSRVNRARSVTGKGIKYGLGKGGMKPEAATPAAYGLCDCSGFLSWGFYLSRKPKTGRGFWIETTAVYRDAKGPQKTFVAIERPVAGCGMVYPDRNGKEGHCAIVTDVAFDAVGKVASIKGVDCSSGQSRRTGDAITERDLTWFLKELPAFVLLREDFA